MKKLSIWVKSFARRMHKGIRLWKICRAAKIKPYPFQKDFALGKTDTLPVCGRCTGKTTAVILQALVENPLDAKQLYQIFQKDPDAPQGPCGYFERYLWMYHEWRKWTYLCMDQNIDISAISLRSFKGVLGQRRYEAGIPQHSPGDETRETVFYAGGLPYEKIIE